ncbi:MAG: type IX secretion system membrane protein PorP/SprF [Chitinophagia bacterium]|nr:type IX secretion system membrane protein PorP/SprF [Chitinophagia bacterium]NCA29904.1 type IX secretion system membrane protein PorP/SprF [Chitinophagia bacterium]
MKNKYFYIFFLLSSLYAKLGYTQTPYNSQGFMSTQYFNPAAVGFGINNRFQSFFRTQYAGVGDPFYTAGAAVDFGFFKIDDNPNNIFGYGIQAVSEKVLNGILQTNAISNSLAYRIFFNKKQTSYFSLGIGYSILTRTLDASLLSFGDQYYSGRLFNPSSLEAISKYPTKYTTNAGFMYGFQSEKSFFQIGASEFLVNRTINTIINNEPNQNYQISALLNVEYQLEDGKTILLHTDYQNRLEKEYFYAGAALGVPLNKEMNRAYFGCFYRSKDALIPYIGLMYNKYKIGLTYDIYNNSLTSSNLRPQTIEFSLTTSLGRRYSENLKSLFD